MRHALLIATLAVFPAHAQDDAQVGGIGRIACAQIIGPSNAPYLAQAGDWALGYMAGRIDAGQEPVDGETLTPDDSVDVIAGMAARCRDMPDAAVIDAVRTYATRIFGTEAEGGAVVAEPPAPQPDLPASDEGAAPRSSQSPPARPKDLVPSNGDAARLKED